jgi:monooxygenase
MKNMTHHDVLIVGAGLSGIGTACHIARAFPNRRLALLERRRRIGGTWDLFRYPGIRSDSDMVSFGYEFKPWHDINVLADGASIRDYLEHAAIEGGIADKIQYGVKVTSADWSSEQRRWTLDVLDEPNGGTRKCSCSFLIICTGYYNHDAGLRPELPGEELFKGTLIHPQNWPDTLDYRGKKVVVIGSGATAVTLVPALAKLADHVTMLQRSPSYVFSLPSLDRMTAGLSLLLPRTWTYRLARWRNIRLQRAAYLGCRTFPHFMRRYLLAHVRRFIGPNVDMRHFTPNYLPWDERLCAVPDADLFKALREGKASMETDHIDCFTEHGIRLRSGKALPADIVIAATGLQLQMLGGLTLSVDGAPRSMGSVLTYKGLLLEGLPNLAWIFGYINASWTLKVDASAKYLCRLFNYMQTRHLDVVVPRDANNSALPVSILDSLRSGYVQRDQHLLPRQGRCYPWRVEMNYRLDKKMLLCDPIEDHRLRFVTAKRHPVAGHTMSAIELPQ